jgi:flagellar biosynthetic protein FliR
MIREIAAINVYQFMLVFARLGMAAMLMPALGGTLVAPRMRLLLALAATFVILPVVSPHLPPMPNAPLRLALLFGTEITIGLYFGVTMQMLMAAIDLAGNFMGYAVGLTNALISDPVTEQQSQLISGFLNLAAVTALLLTDGHHLMLRAIADSYTLFVPGAALPLGDFSKELVTTLGASFVVGLKLAAPLVIFSLVFNVGLGLLNRLVPQMQVFFVGMPMQILGGLSIMALSIAVILYSYLQYFDRSISAYVSPGG